MGSVVQTSKLPLTAIVITRNEERMLARALKSVQFCDDILVVDAESTDSTVNIARELGARVEERAWSGFGDQRNFALAHSKHDWVLVLDADEAASPELAAWLAKFFKDKKNESAESNGYKIKRAEYLLAERIYGACWNPSFQDRLFRRSKARYVGEIHEYPEVEGGLLYAPETAMIFHNPNVAVESFLEKMNRYTTVEAFDRYQKGQRTSISHLLVAFFANWFKNFFYYKGYRDGRYGVVVCLLEAVSRTVRHIKLWQIQEMDAKGQLHLLPDAKKLLNSGAAMHRKLEVGAKTLP